MSGPVPSPSMKQMIGRSGTISLSPWSVIFWPWAGILGAVTDMGSSGGRARCRCGHLMIKARRDASDGDVAIARGEKPSRQRPRGVRVRASLFPRVSRVRRGDAQGTGADRSTAVPEAFRQFRDGGEARRRTDRAARSARRAAHRSGVAGAGRRASGAGARRRRVDLARHGGRWPQARVQQRPPRHRRRRHGHRRTRSRAPERPPRRPHLRPRRLRRRCDATAPDGGARRRARRRARPGRPAQRRRPRTPHPLRLARPDPGGAAADAACRRAAAQHQRRRHRPRRRHDDEGGKAGILLERARRDDRSEGSQDAAVEPHRCRGCAIWSRAASSAAA